ncbi:MAG TPA: 7-carboxy-7-deazaguanine synthase QueE [Bacteroidia bacterium]|nr:7-carboxy-7-deazaguanine synthase QueE [Bacteroidia bacterium]
MEHFYTIQGEGYYSGQAAYFIRLAGCDVGCVWCDVKESWDASIHPKYSVDEIVKWVTDSKARIAVITGGEPLLHQLDELTTALQAKGIRTHIETSASSPLSGTWNWICVSPKKFKKPLNEVTFTAHELKVVVFNKSDLEWAEQHAQHVSKNCRLYLQPEWDKKETVLPLIIDYVKQHPQWTISIQTHKYINIP